MGIAIQVRGNPENPMNKEAGAKVVSMIFVNSMNLSN
jgi:hypothetical protein